MYTLRKKFATRYSSLIALFSLPRLITIAPTWEVLCVLFVFGAATHFAFPTPDLSILVGFCVGAMALALLLKMRVTMRPIGFCCLAIMLGVIVAHWQTYSTARSAPDAPLRGVATIEGSVVDMQLRDNRTRVIIAPQTINNQPYTYDGWKLRLYGYQSQGAPQVGDMVSVRALMRAPSQPLVPGGYDFSKISWYKKFHAEGFVISKIELITHDQNIGFLAKFRLDISQAIANTLTAPNIAIARALLIGQRDPLPAEIKDALRDSGLMHLLAISGLHMGMVCGFVFFAVRFGLARIHNWALFRPIKSYAAVCAMLIGAGYLTLAGFGIPAQRAYIMVAMAFLGVILWRQALSMRLVAFAGLVVVLINPSSVIGPSFQLSFLAVVALIALHRHLKKNKIYFTNAIHNPYLRFIDKARTVIIGSALISLVATFATAPVTLHYFGQISTVGVLANLIAVPLMGVWVMPVGLIGVLMVPLGFEAPFFNLMGWGIDAILSYTQWLVRFPYASIKAPGISVYSMLAGIIGVLWISMMRGKVALLGALASVIVFADAIMIDRPTVIIDAQRRYVAVQNHADNGQYFITGTRSNHFVGRLWQDNYAISRLLPMRKASKSLSHVNCDADGCIVNMGNSERIAIPENMEAVIRDCDQATIVVFRDWGLPDNWCKGTGQAMLLDRWDIADRGAIAIHQEDSGSYRLIGDYDKSTPWAHTYGRSK